MATTVHLDATLVAWLDREAARSGITRNRLIATILQRAMNQCQDWPQNLFPALVESAYLDEKK